MDYNLTGCLCYNPQHGYGWEDIKTVLAQHEGQNDEENWHWILELNSGEYVYLEGGCDYTGWDCVSHAESIFFQEDPKTWLHGRAAYGVLEGTHHYIRPDIVQELLDQLDNGRHETWREMKDKEFGVESMYESKSNE